MPDARRATAWRRHRDVPHNALPCISTPPPSPAARAARAGARRDRRRLRRAPARDRSSLWRDGEVVEPAVAATEGLAARWQRGRPASGSPRSPARTRRACARPSASSGGPRPRPAADPVGGSRRRPGRRTRRLRGAMAQAARRAASRAMPRGTGSGGRSPRSSARSIPRAARRPPTRAGSLSLEGTLTAASRRGDESRRFSFHGPESESLADELRGRLAGAAEPREAPMPCPEGTPTPCSPAAAPRALPRDPLAPARRRRRLAALRPRRRAGRGLGSRGPRRRDAARSLRRVRGRRRRGPPAVGQAARRRTPGGSADEPRPRGADAAGSPPTATDGAPRPAIRRCPAARTSSSPPGARRRGGARASARPRALDRGASTAGSVELVERVSFRLRFPRARRVRRGRLADELGPGVLAGEILAALKGVESGSAAKAHAYRPLAWCARGGQVVAVQGAAPDVLIRGPRGARARMTESRDDRSGCSRRGPRAPGSSTASRESRASSWRAGRRALRVRAPGGGLRGALVGPGSPLRRGVERGERRGPRPLARDARDRRGARRPRGRRRRRGAGTARLARGAADLFEELARLVAAESRGEATLAELSPCAGARRLERVVNAKGLDVAWTRRPLTGHASAVGPARARGPARRAPSSGGMASRTCRRLARRLSDRATLPLSDRRTPIDRGEWLLDCLVAAALLAGLAPLFLREGAAAWAVRGAILPPEISVVDDATGRRAFRRRGHAQRGASCSSSAETGEAGSTISPRRGHAGAASDGPRRPPLLPDAARARGRAASSSRRSARSRSGTSWPRSGAGSSPRALTAPLSCDLENDRYDAQFTGVAIVAGRAQGPVARRAARGRLSELLRRIAALARIGSFFRCPIRSAARRS